MGQETASPKPKKTPAKTAPGPASGAPEARHGADRSRPALKAGDLHSRLVQPDLLNRLEEALRADSMPIKGAGLSRGHRYISALVDVELGDFLDQEAARLNGLRKSGRLVGPSSSAHSLALTALESRLPSLSYYQQFLAKVQDRRRAIGQVSMSLRVPNKLYSDLETLHVTIAHANNKVISVKGIAEALIFAWATALKEENRFQPGGKTREARSARSARQQPSARPSARRK